MLMSACGRSVIVGFSPESGDHDDVIEERKMGHSVIAFDSVFRRIGRYVKRVKCADGGTEGGGS